MDGVTILNTIPEAVSYNTVGIVISSIMVILGIILIALDIEKELSEGIITGLSLCLLCITGLIGLFINLNLPTVIPQRYEVTISDNISFNDFDNKYTIIEQRGQIYVVEERTMKGNN